jgi:hypothetical protein
MRRGVSHWVDEDELGDESGEGKDGLDVSGSSDAQMVIEHSYNFWWYLLTLHCRRMSCRMSVSILAR